MTQFEEQLLILQTRYPAIGTISKLVASAAGKRFLLFSHDDPDGLTSALLATRMIEHFGGSVRIVLPPRFFLLQEDYETAVAEEPADYVFIMDKGTRREYDDLSGDPSRIVIIDHHPPQGIPEECILLNPNLETFFHCSTSYLVYAIMSTCMQPQADDRLFNLIGLTGDFVLNTAIGRVAESIRGFFEAMKAEFGHLFSPIEDRPTMFEVDQRAHTTLLNRMTELLHGVGGGGFQYFYRDRHPDLAAVDPPLFLVEQLREMAHRGIDTGSLQSLDDFIAMFPDAPRIRMQWQYFLEDWRKYSERMDEAVRIGTIGEMSFYLFIGHDIRLMPMIGSVKLYELSQRSGDDKMFMIMVNLTDHGTHVSFRATRPDIHMGTIATRLASSLVRFDSLETISGGGHPMAAECVVNSPRVTALALLTELLAMLYQFEQLNGRDLLPEERRDAIRLGLRYLENVGE